MVGYSRKQTAYLTVPEAQMKKSLEQGEKYFGGGIKKQISSGVNIEGSFEKKGDLKQGKIKLKVEY